MIAILHHGSIMRICPGCAGFFAPARHASSLSAIRKGRLKESHPGYDPEDARPRTPRRSDSSNPRYGRPSDGSFTWRDESTNGRFNDGFKPRRSPAKAAEINAEGKGPARTQDESAPSIRRVQTGSALDEGDAFTRSSLPEATSDGPGLPFATAASTFIYGHSAAMACLRAGRRRVNRAWLQTPTIARGIEALLKARSIDIRPATTRSDLAAMDRVAQGRPHNGIVLDVSPLPYPPVLALGPVRSAPSPTPQHTAPLHMAAQSSEEQRANAALLALPLPRSTWRHPLVLYLDGIRDEGNAGNIVRTAHFYGADAVAVCAGTCAPAHASAVAAKAASGAMEAVPLLRVDAEFGFVKRCRANGWRVFASVAPDAAGGRGAKLAGQGLAPTVTTGALRGRSPLAEGPCVLMLGGEGEGLRPGLVRLADERVTIVGAGRSAGAGVGVDSMNVASAAAVLLEVFMRPPEGVEEEIQEVEEAGVEDVKGLQEEEEERMF